VNCANTENVLTFTICSEKGHLSHVDIND